MHTLHFSAADKAARYQEILPQIESIIAGESNLTANLANTAAVLKEAFGWFWVGFYLVERESEELVLAPFQGPVACTRIAFGRGVCGQAWAKGETIVVEDVNKHPDHIACSALSQSEIVVPLFDSDGLCYGVLDIDDDKPAQFDETDAHHLNRLAGILGRLKSLDSQ
ncbi:GAF domain-containing protein [Neisseria chenwenguii]|uniref:Diguanylate cyclase n=1 Tax=Neisseria chenwenguii TaxID=1853278 RepID=A0A220S0D4_9NEIS|nr:GAF domain-containing protein [Neisseria chenwenguii]ASK26907.1 diguanylate cyclase [Neisseria chenwenguii]ROV56704.1 GAF domain-containing protein [Neisseria chenwenguii]